MFKNTTAYKLLAIILETGLRPDDSIETKRLYHQVNGLNLFYTFIALSVAIFSFTILAGSRATFIMGIVQIVATILYSSNILLNKFRFIKATQHMTIIIFEWHLFFLTVLTNAWNSPILLVVVLYPLLAALVEVKIFTHLFVGLFQVVLCISFRYYQPALQMQLENFASVGGMVYEILRMMGIFYFPVMAAVIVSIIHNQNLWARNVQKEFLVKQGKLIDEISNINNIMNMQMVMAQKIQGSIIPKKFPESDYIKFHGVYLPMDSVGGDFYDVFKIGEDRMAVFIADVSGHGISAALITMLVKVTLRMYAAENLASSQIVHKVNNTLCEILEDVDNYVTLFFGVIDLGTITMDYTNAGHNDVYVLSEEGEVTILSARETIIGKIKDCSYTSNTVKLERNSKVILYTDGIPEARDYDKQFFTNERLIELLRENRKMSPQDLAGKIISEVKSFIGDTVFSDDVSLVVMQVVNDPVVQRLDEKYIQALELINNSQLESARLILADLLEEYPKAADKYKIAYTKAVISYKLADYKASLEDFEKALVYNPDSKQVKTNIIAVKKKINPTYMQRTLAEVERAVAR